MARLSGDMKTIDIDEVQSSLELQDDARSHYSTDDLVRKEVIEGATSDIHSKEYGEKGRASEMKG